MLDLCSFIHSLVFPKGHHLAPSEAPPKHSLGERSLGHVSRGSAGITVPSSALCPSPLPRIPLQPLHSQEPPPISPKEISFVAYSPAIWNPCGGPHHSFHSVPETPSWTNLQKWHRNATQASQMALRTPPGDKVISAGLLSLKKLALPMWISPVINM